MPLESLLGPPFKLEGENDNERRVLSSEGYGVILALE